MPIVIPLVKWHSHSNVNTERERRSRCKNSKWNGKAIPGELPAIYITGLNMAQYTTYNVICSSQYKQLAVKTWVLYRGDSGAWPC